MASITLRNIPDSLLKIIKSVAASERRSLNNEIIRSLENLYSTREHEQTQIEKLRKLRTKWEVDDDFYRSVTEAVSSRSYGRDVDLDK